MKRLDLRIFEEACAFITLRLSSERRRSCRGVLWLSACALLSCRMTFWSKFLHMPGKIDEPAATATVLALLWLWWYRTTYRWRIRWSRVWIFLPAAFDHLLCLSGKMHRYNKEAWWSIRLWTAFHWRENILYMLRKDHAFSDLGKAAGYRCLRLLRIMAEEQLNVYQCGPLLHRNDFVIASQTIGSMKGQGTRWCQSLWWVSQ